MHMSYNRDKLELRRGENIDLKNQNLFLKAKVACLMEELKCIKYYIKFEVDGHTPKSILKLVKQLRQDKASLQVKLEDLKKKFNIVVPRAKRKLKEIGEKLKMQQNEVIRPLIQEIKINEELTRRLKQQYDTNLKEFQALSTIVRIPAMTSEFWRILRTKESRQVNEEKEK